MFYALNSISQDSHFWYDRETEWQSVEGQKKQVHLNQWHQIPDLDSLHLAAPPTLETLFRKFSQHACFTSSERCCFPFLLLQAPSPAPESSRTPEARNIGTDLNILLYLLYAGYLTLRQDLLGVLRLHGKPCTRICRPLKHRIRRSGKTALS